MTGCVTWEWRVDGVDGVEGWCLGVLVGVEVRCVLVRRGESGGVVDKIRTDFALDRFASDEDSLA